MNLHGDVDAYLEFAEVVAEVGGAEGHEHEGEGGEGHRRGRPTPTGPATAGRCGNAVPGRAVAATLCVGMGSNLRRHSDFCVFDASTTCRHLVAN